MATWRRRTDDYRPDGHRADHHRGDSARHVLFGKNHRRVSADQQERTADYGIAQRVSVVRHADASHTHRENHDRAGGGKAKSAEEKRLPSGDRVAYREA